MLVRVSLLLQVLLAVGKFWSGIFSVGFVFYIGLSSTKIYDLNYRFVWHLCPVCVCVLLVVMVVVFDFYNIAYCKCLC